MRSRAVVLMLLTVAVVISPQPASAKGASRAVITGPGLDSPIEIGRKGSQDIYKLADAAGVYQLVFETTPNTVVDEQPVKELGPRYDVAYLFSAPGKKANFVHQDLYPYAQSGPVTYVAPGQAVFGGETVGGWFEASFSLLPFLVSKGLPAPKDAPTGNAAPAQKADESKDSGDAAAAPAPPSTPSTPSSSDPWPVALLTGAGVVGAVAAAGVVLRRRRPGSARGAI